MLRRCDTCEVDEDTAAGRCWNCGNASILHSPVGQGATRRGGLNPTERAEMLAAGYRGLL